jgi:cell division control protein 6
VEGKVVEYIEAAISRVKDSVFVDESRLDFDYMPLRLLHRDVELKRLAQAFHLLLDNLGRASPRALVFGGVGVGKTVLAKFFGENLIKVAKSREVNLVYVYLNCRTVESKWSLVLNLAMKVNPHELAVRGYGPSQMLRGICDYLNDNDLYLLLTLDEVDFFIKRTGENMIYDSTRLGAELTTFPKRIGVIFIARDHAIYELPQLDPSTVSILFGANTIELPPYQALELRDILLQRMIEAFKPYTVSEEVVDFIADIAGEQGDARYAIEILAFAGRYADLEDSRRVTPEHVRKARMKIHPRIRQDYLAPLSIQEKVILLAVARGLKPDEAYIDFKDVRKAYQICCEEYALTKIGLVQLQDVLAELSKTGLVNLKNVHGRLLVSLPEIPIEILRRELENTINNERNKYRQSKKRPICS